MKKLKYISDNFIKNFEKVMEYNRELSECIFLLYNKNTQYKEFSELLTRIHIESNKIFTSVGEEVYNISKITQNWPTYFEKIQTLIDQRDEARRNYDHYESKVCKMEKLYDQRQRNECLYRHPKFTDALERNEKKYIFAKKNYLDKTTIAYYTIQTLLDKRFDIINPVLMRLFAVETKIYEGFASQYALYKTMKENIQNKVNIEAIVEQRVYNPLKFMKHGDLEKKFKFGDLRRSKSEFLRRARSFEDSYPERSLTTNEEFDKIENIYSPTVDKEIHQLGENTNNNFPYNSNNSSCNNTYSQKIILHKNDTQ